MFLSTARWSNVVDFDFTDDRKMLKQTVRDRDMKLCTIGEGTSEIQRLVIARELLKSL